ncbi:MAG: hypothetical protein HYW85_05200 [Deltaproteobacteria bacterium]|nr:hypothetical protein [Deltaproteobacteria bacterium]
MKRSSILIIFILSLTLGCAPRDNSKENNLIPSPNTVSKALPSVESEKSEPLAEDSPSEIEDYSEGYSGVTVPQYTISEKSRVGSGLAMMMGGALVTAAGYGTHRIANTFIKKYAAMMPGTLVKNLALKRGASRVALWGARAAMLGGLALTGLGIVELVLEPTELGDGEISPADRFEDLERSVYILAADPENIEKQDRVIHDVLAYLPDVIHALKLEYNAHVSKLEALKSEAKAEDLKSAEKAFEEYAKEHRKAIEYFEKNLEILKKVNEAEVKDRKKAQEILDASMEELNKIYGSKEESTKIQTKDQESLVESSSPHLYEDVTPPVEVDTSEVPSTPARVGIGLAWMVGGFLVLNVGAKAEEALFRLNSVYWKLAPTMTKKAQLEVAQGVYQGATKMIQKIGFKKAVAKRLAAKIILTRTATGLAVKKGLSSLFGRAIGLGKWACPFMWGIGVMQIVLDPTEAGGPGDEIGPEDRFNFLKEDFEILEKNPTDINLQDRFIQSTVAYLYDVVNILEYESNQMILGYEELKANKDVSDQDKQAAYQDLEAFYEEQDGLIEYFKIVTVSLKEIMYEVKGSDRSKAETILRETMPKLEAIFAKKKSVTKNGTSPK